MSFYNMKMSDCNKEFPSSITIRTAAISVHVRICRRHTKDFLSEMCLVELYIPRHEMKFVS